MRNHAHSSNEAPTDAPAHVSDDATRPLTTRRAARRAQQREDYIRATTQAIHDHGIKVPSGASLPGATHGKTVRQHVEDLALQAALDYVRDKTPTKRGILRGAALAYLAHVDSYRLDDPAALKQVESRLVREAQERNMP